MGKKQISRIALATLGGAVVAGTALGFAGIKAEAAQSGYSSYVWVVDDEETGEGHDEATGWDWHYKWVDGEELRWYENKNTGEYLSNGWYLIDYNWYKLDADGYETKMNYIDGYKNGSFDYAQNEKDGNFEFAAEEREKLKKENDPMSWKSSDGKWYYGNEAGGYLSAHWIYNGKNESTGEEYWNWDNGIYNIDGTMYAFDSDGYLRSEGWFNTAATDSSKYRSEKDDAWVYVNADGTLATGWKEISGKWYYFDERGNLPSVAGWELWIDYEGKDRWEYNDGIAKIGDKLYAFDESGALRGEGWLNREATDSKSYNEYSDAKWVYVEADGSLATGWKKVKNDWYYFDYSESKPDEEYKWWSLYMCKGGLYNLNKDGGLDAYVFNQDGTLAKGGWVSTREWSPVRDYDGVVVAWNKLTPSWLYTDANGKPYTGWQKINGDWYYFSTDETWLNVDGSSFISAGGFLCRGEYRDGYWLDADTGVAATEKAEWHEGAGGSYWYGTSDYYLAEKWTDADGYYEYNYSTKSVEWVDIEQYLSGYYIDGTLYRFTKDGYYYSWEASTRNNAEPRAYGVADWFKDYVKDGKAVDTWYTYKMDEDGNIYYEVERQAGDFTYASRTYITY